MWPQKPLESGFLKRKSEKKGPNFLGPLLLIGSWIQDPCDTFLILNSGVDLQSVLGFVYWTQPVSMTLRSRLLQFIVFNISFSFSFVIALLQGFHAWPWPLLLSLLSSPLYWPPGLGIDYSNISNDYNDNYNDIITIMISRRIRWLFQHIPSLQPPWRQRYHHHKLVKLSQSFVWRSCQMCWSSQTKKIF